VFSPRNTKCRLNDAYYLNQKNSDDYKYFTTYIFF
jgi:hypothetical protein